MDWGSGIRRKPIPDSGSLVRNTTTFFLIAGLQGRLLLGAGRLQGAHQEAGAGED
jgi:hypothetical protein